MISSGANVTTRPAVTEKELLDYLNTFGGTSALLPAEQMQFLNVAKAYGLNPFKREIYATAYGSGENRQCSILVGYEVYLKRAERTGLLDGWDATFAGAGQSLSCKITIYRKDWNRPFFHEVYYSETVQCTKSGNVNKFWAKMPRTMLRKVAISQGFRLCFSDDLGGMPYDDSELGGERDVTEPAPPPPPPDHVAEERKRVISNIKDLLETKDPDGLPYFDEHAVKRWGDRVREIPRDGSGLAALKETEGLVRTRLEGLVSTYKPIPFEAVPATSTGTNAAALAMEEPEPEVDPETADIVEELFAQRRERNLASINTTAETER
jgi:phage recombination protein Bet